MRHNIYVCAIATVVSLGQLACGSDSATFAPTSDQHLLLASVALTEHAYNLSTVAPYDTAQLHVSATLADGTPAPVTFRFRSTVPSQVAVDSLTGLITAVSGVPSQDAQGNLLTGCSGTFIANPQVIVSAMYRGITRYDTAIVGIIDHAPDRLLQSLHLVSPLGHVATVERAIIGTSNTTHVLIELRDVTDSVAQTPGGLCIGLTSADSSVVNSFNFGFSFVPYRDTSYLPMNVSDTGQTWVYASVYAYGKSLKDSLLIQVLAPHIHTVRANLVPPIPLPNQAQVIKFFPESLAVSPGAVITFFAPIPTDANVVTGPPIDIIFNHPADVAAVTEFTVEPVFKCYDDQGVGCGLNEHGGSGNIAPFHFDFSTFGDSSTTGGEARLFSKRGRYDYHTSSGAAGVIIVQ